MENDFINQFRKLIENQIEIIQNDPNILFNLNLGLFTQKNHSKIREILQKAVYNKNTWLNWTVFFLIIEGLMNEHIISWQELFEYFKEKSRESKLVIGPLKEFNILFPNALFEPREYGIPFFIVGPIRAITKLSGILDREKEKEIFIEEIESLFKQNLRSNEFRIEDLLSITENKCYKCKESISRILRSVKDYALKTEVNQEDFNEFFDEHVYCGKISSIIDLLKILKSDTEFKARVRESNNINGLDNYIKETYDRKYSLIKFFINKTHLIDFLKSIDPDFYFPYVVTLHIFNKEIKKRYVRYLENKIVNPYHEEINFRDLHKIKSVYGLYQFKNKDIQFYFVNYFLFQILINHKMRLLFESQNTGTVGKYEIINYSLADRNEIKATREQIYLYQGIPNNKNLIEPNKLVFNNKSYEFEYTKLNLGENRRIIFSEPITLLRTGFSVIEKMIYVDQGKLYLKFQFQSFPDKSGRFLNSAFAKIESNTIYIIALDELFTENPRKITFEHNFKEYNLFTLGLYSLADDNLLIRRRFLKSNNFYLIKKIEADLEFLSNNEPYFLDEPINVLWNEVEIHRIQILGSSFKIKLKSSLEYEEYKINVDFTVYDTIHQNTKSIKYDAAIPSLINFEIHFHKNSNFYSSNNNMINNFFIYRIYGELIFKDQSESLDKQDLIEYYNENLSHFNIQFEELDYNNNQLEERVENTSFIERNLILELTYEHHIIQKLKPGKIKIHIDYIGKEDETPLFQQTRYIYLFPKVEFELININHNETFFNAKNLSSKIKLEIFDQEIKNQMVTIHYTMNTTYLNGSASFSKNKIKFQSKIPIIPKNMPEIILNPINKLTLQIDIKFQRRNSKSWQINYISNNEDYILYFQNLKKFVFTINKSETPGYLVAKEIAGNLKVEKYIERFKPMIRVFAIFNVIDILNEGYIHFEERIPINKLQIMSNVDIQNTRYIGKTLVIKFAQPQTTIVKIEFQNEFIFIIPKELYLIKIENSEENTIISYDIKKKEKFKFQLDSMLDLTNIFGNSMIFTYNSRNNLYSIIQTLISKLYTIYLEKTLSILLKLEDMQISTSKYFSNAIIFNEVMISSYNEESENPTTKLINLITKTILESEELNRIYIIPRKNLKNLILKLNIP